MAEKTKQFGLVSKYENLTLKPLKKLDFKAFCDFSKEYDGEDITIEEYLGLWASKEFQFLQTGKLWLYLFEKKTADKFDAGEIIGYFEITPSEKEENTAEIGYFVKESKRNCGFAKKMLEMAITTCAQMGYETLTAKVHKENNSSIAVLKSSNFEIYKSETSDIQAILNIKL